MWIKRLTHWWTKFGQRYSITALKVLVIEYCNLEFICYLVLVVWSLENRFNDKFLITDVIRY
jgi:hypothetical protein